MEPLLMLAYDQRAYQLVRTALKETAGSCQWCGRALAPGEGDADHVGGLGDPRLVRSCAHCNRGRQQRELSPGSGRFFH